MTTYLQRLRRQCEPVQEDTPVPERGFGVRVDIRDLKQLLADYDALLLAYREDMGFGE